MWLGENDRTELYQKLLKSNIVQFLSLSFIQQFNINFPDKILHLVIVG